jgi:hypothetical protein
MKRTTLPLPLLLSTAGLLALPGCDLTATTVVAGTLVLTPEIKVPGQFDVAAEVVASAWVAERESATSTTEPKGIKGATVGITFPGNRVELPEEGSQDGLYLTTSVDDAALEYLDGTQYTFRATLPDGSVAEYGGTVKAPTRLSPAVLTLDPTPTAVFPDLTQVGVHPKNTALTVSWPAEQYGRYAYVSVFRAKANDLENPELVFDNRPESAEEIIQFILGTPPTSVSIPADTFAQDGIYGVVVVIMNKQDDLLPNTFLGSPILAGSGAAILLGVSSSL